MELIETSIFTKQITALLSDEEYGEFRSRIAANPDLGAPISGAVRKDVILLLYTYPKNAAADLTPKQVSQLAKIVKKEFG